MNLPTQLLSIYTVPLTCRAEKNVFIVSTCNIQSHVCVPGWPGAHHSIDACEDLEWPGGRDAFHPSDTDEEVLVQLVRPNVIQEDKQYELLVIEPEHEAGF